MDFVCANCKQPKSETPSIYLLLLGSTFNRLCKDCATKMRSKREEKNYKVNEYLIMRRRWS